MDKMMYTMVIITLMAIYSVLDERKSEIYHKELMQKFDEVMPQDPCQQIHGLKTIESRDYKPKYNRGLKQVVSTCGEVKK